MENKPKHDGSVAEEISAVGQRAKGAVKRTVGDVVNDRGLEREGARENAAGRARQQANDAISDADRIPGSTLGLGSPSTPSASRYADDTAAEEASAMGQRAKGAVKDAVGSISGNERLEREGEIENARGRARQATNNVMDETDGVRGATSGSKRDRYVTGLYTSPEAASRAYDGLTSSHGYRAEDVNVVMSDDTRKRHFGDVPAGAELSGGTKAAEGFGKGSAIGGGIGAALGALFAVGTSIIIPGLGLVVAGPIAAALAGAGAGGATGGLVGALIGAGIPEERARVYERGINEGGILIGTRARDEKHAAELERDFGKYGGTNVLK